MNEFQVNVVSNDETTTQQDLNECGSKRTSRKPIGLKWTLSQMSDLKWSGLRWSGLSYLHIEVAMPYSRATQLFQARVQLQK